MDGARLYGIVLRMKVQHLSKTERARIFQEGRMAALDHASPFTCPYIKDKSDERFDEWVDGFRSANERPAP